MSRLILLVLIFVSSIGFAQVPEDVFLEAEPATQALPPVEDLPPDEPPYTKTPDELEAQQLLAPAQKPEPKKEVRIENGAKPTPTVITDEAGRKKIGHPESKRGLYLIDQNTGRYYYKTEKLSKKNQSTSIRVGMITPPKIVNDSTGVSQTFENIYGEDTLPYLILDYEWQPIRSFGKLGVVLGAGFFTASGNGRFANASVQGGAAAKEGFTFIGFPINAGGIYRLEFSDKQWLAPFVNAGFSYYILGELRDDGKAPKIVGTPAGYGGAGVLFNITAWSKDIDFTLDREYGINSMWLAAEFRVIQSLNEDLDISSNMVNIGVAVDY